MPVPPGLPLEGQTALERVRRGDGPYFRKPEDLEEGADTLPPLKRFPPPEQEEEDERFPDGQPYGGGQEPEGPASGEPDAAWEPERASEWETTRFEETKEDL